MTPPPPLDWASPDLVRFWKKAAPGWYPDLVHTHRSRIWDGAAWTAVVTSTTDLPPKPPEIRPGLRAWRHVLFHNNGPAQ
jgi:hypothetical protein